MSCQARLPCDPITEQPCPGNQGCYFDWDSYRFECYTAGTLAGGAVCTQEYDCARGDGCGSNYACVPYCNVASPTNCAAPLSCTDYNGDGTVGYCE
jgi:hypothetical protein